MTNERYETSETALSTGASEDYEWAVGCSDCDAVLPMHSEESAHRQYLADIATEARIKSDVDDRHTITLLRRPLVIPWETVTTSAWDGRRDAS